MQTVRFPGWRTMTSAQRRNAKMDAMFERARQLGHTTFNADADKWEVAARAAGWIMRDSHFTRHGVSIAYVDWKTLCIEERITA